jgi:hypothetical protein
MYTFAQLQNGKMDVLPINAITIKNFLQIHYCKFLSIIESFHIKAMVRNRLRLRSYGS